MPPCEHNSEQCQNALPELRQKIQSKMAVLAVLAGFSTAVLTATAIALADDDPTGSGVSTNPDAISESTLFMLIAMVLFFASAVVQIGTLLGYDRLMMPERFWRTGWPRAFRTWGKISTGVVWRPPSSAGWIVYQESVRLWQWAIYAFIADGIGAFLLMAAVATRAGFEHRIIAAAAVTAVLLAAICRWQLWPATGSPD